MMLAIEQNFQENPLREHRRPQRSLELEWIGDQRRQLSPTEWSVDLETTRGLITTRYHATSEDEDAESDMGVVWVGGAGGGLDGPARGLYPEACERLQAKGVVGLRLHYRYPNDLPECVLDTLIGVEFLNAKGVERVALVGHSFGGAVVITAGAMSPQVVAVVPMSTQTYGTELAPDISPRHLLLIHGDDDEILPDLCSRQVFAIAQEPKELVIYPGARHGLDRCHEELLDLLTTWLPAHLAPA